MASLRRLRLRGRARRGASRRRTARFPATRNSAMRFAARCPTTAARASGRGPWCRRPSSAHQSPAGLAVAWGLALRGRRAHARRRRGSRCRERAAERRRALGARRRARRRGARCAVRARQRARRPGAARAGGRGAHGLSRATAPSGGWGAYQRGPPGRRTACSSSAGAAASSPRWTPGGNVRWLPFAVAARARRLGALGTGRGLPASRTSPASSGCGSSTATAAAITAMAPARAAVAPAWRPDDRHVLAYVDARGRVSVVAVDSRTATVALLRLQARARWRGRRAASACSS